MRAAFLLLAVASVAAVPTGWSSLSDIQRQQFTMDGAVRVEHLFVDERVQGEPMHIKFSRASIDKMIDSFGKANTFDQDPVEKAMAPLDLTNKTIVVFGSQRPHYEALCIARGAREVVVVEYGPRTYDHPKIRVVTVEDARTSPALRGMFDFALSISSFDHDGLGRYGDPLDPTGDLRAMSEVIPLLQPPTREHPGGILILTVPVSHEDLLVWNTMRVYGPLRFPKLIERFVEIAKFGWDDDKYNKPSSDYRRTFEPAFVLGPRYRQSQHDEL